MKVKYLLDGNIKISGLMDDNVDFVLENQLKDRKIWNKFTEVFITKEDVIDDGWRCEYFGKMMRGASLIYAYRHDEELYSVLTEAVKKLLDTQDEKGRISTYTVEKEFRGWDVWGRKYVITGLLHYCSICRDKVLINRIMAALERHLDYIVEKIGNKEGQIKITDTTTWWGGIASCSILEPVVEMYRLTKKKEYLAFAEYILSVGVCECGNLVEIALKNEILPYRYPTVKAYETISFFEGVLAYYEVTRQKKYFEAVQNFVEAVAESDITLIGCAGCTHELFDNSALKQTEYSQTIMQETCVTVTWMRILARLYALTGDSKYIDRFEKSGFNALYGSLNTEHNEQYSFEREKYVSSMAFDSYSPLYMNKRGRGIGGYKEFASGGYYGCCIAIAACGIALMPLVAVMKDEKGPIINFLSNAVLKEEKYTLKMKSAYPSESKGIISIECDEQINLTLRIRCPNWCKKMTANGVVAKKEGYYVISGDFHNGDTINVNYETDLIIERLNGKVAFTYGPLVMAADSLKTRGDISAPIRANGIKYTVLPPERGELERLEVTSHGEKILLTDYQSCGKKWHNENSIISVWLNEKR